MHKQDDFNGKYIFCISLVAAMGGLLFGYDWVVIGGAKPYYEPFFGLTGPENAALAGWAMSSALAGCLLGALLSGAITDALGRKKVLMIAALLFTASAIWTALAGNFDAFILARILGGIGIGLASNVSPMYIAEISPAHMRGKFVSINQLTIVIGVLAAQLANLGIYNIEPVASGATTDEVMNSWNGQTGWRWMFAAETLPAVLFLILSFVIPESPRWLIKKGRNAEASAILSKIGGPDYAAFETKDILKTLADKSKAAGLGALLEPKVRLILIVGMFLAAFQQWCGINVIFNYADEIFRSAGFDYSDLMISIVATGLVNLVFTFVAIFTVDKLGRRSLMLLGSGGLMGIYALMGACYYFEFQGIAVLIVVALAVACYAMTLAPITWVLLSEIFPNRVRAAAMSLCVSVLWIACFGLTYSFPLINVKLGASGTFWLYGAICLVGFVFISKFVPETKNKSLEDIEPELTEEAELVETVR